MKALFLAAGFSTRLYPLTENFPKGLLPVGERPIIDRLMNQVGQLLETRKISEVALITNHRYFDAYHEYAHELDFPVQIIDNQTDHPDNRLGAIGDLVLALDLLGWQDDVLILPSDTLVSLSLADLLEFYGEHEGFTNVVFDTKDASVIANQLGCAKLAGDRLIEFVEKPAQPASTLTSVPVYIYPHSDLSLVHEYELKPGSNLDSPGAIIPWLIGRTMTFGYQIEGYYFDVGTPEAYNRLLHNLEI